MIQNPKNLTEQLMNLAERLAIEMRAILNTVEKLAIEMQTILNTVQTKLDSSKWNELKNMAFKDSVSQGDLDKVTPDPTEFFKQKYEETGQ